VFQSCLQDSSLCLYVVRPAKGMSEFETYRMNGSRRAHQTRLLRVQCHKNSRNANHFNAALHRDHGAMAERSASGQQDGICAGLLDFVGDGRNCLLVDLI